MDPTTLKQLFNYDAWANQRIFNTLATLSEDELDRPMGTVGLGTIRETAAHIVAAQDIWYTRWTGHNPTAIKTAKDYHGSLDQLIAEATRLHGAITSLLDQLTSSDLLSTWSYTSTEGKIYSTQLWCQMLHLVNHGTDHRSQLCSMVSMLGKPAPVLDMIVYFREKP